MDIKPQEMIAEMTQDLADHPGIKAGVIVIVDKSGNMHRAEVGMKQAPSRPAAPKVIDLVMPEGEG